MEVKGQIFAIYNEQQISPDFKKREFVLMTGDNPQYPQYVKFECVKEKCDLLNNLQQNQEVTVEFNLNGRLYNDKNTGEQKTFNVLQCWKIQSNQQSQPAQNQPQQNQNQQFQQPPNNDNGPF
jgi:hypothetical protein